PAPPATSTLSLHDALPISIAVIPKRDSTGDWEMTLESRGTRFSYSRFEPKIDWSVRFMDSAGVASPAATPRGLPRLDFMWYRAPTAYKDLARDHWSLDATGT